MKARLLLAVLAAVVMLSAPASDAAAQQRRAARPAVARDWTRVAVRTPEGGVRMGNPAAPVKLIEYGSVTCPHCAAFANTGTQPLYAHVRTGRVSWEYRPYMIFPTDPGLFALLGCEAPGAFFGTVEQLYATQLSWASLVEGWLDANQTRLAAMSAPQRSLAMIRAGQLDGLFRARGMTPAQINACVGNVANLRRVADLTRVANTRFNVSSTPTFFVNGVQASGVVTWSGLEPLLIRAGARR
jgi:protein-disulfide isomerase